MRVVTRTGLLFLLALCSLGGGSVLAESEQFAEDYRMCPPGSRLEALSGVRVRIGAREQLIVEWEQPHPDAWHLADTAAITVVTDAPRSLKQDKDLASPHAVFDDMDYINHVWTFKVAITDRGTVISEIVSRSFPFGDDKPGSQSRTAQSANNGASGTQSPATAPGLIVDFESSYLSLTEGNTVTVTSRLSEKPPQPVTLPLTTTYHGGASPGDYSEVPAAVTFSEEEVSTTFTIQGVDDGTDEEGESMVLSFGRLPFGISAGYAAVTIALEDPTSYTEDSGSIGGQVTLTNSDPRTISLGMTVTQPVITIASETNTYYILVRRGTTARYEARWNPTDNSESHKPVHITGSNPTYTENLATVCQEDPFPPILLTSSMRSEGNMPAFLKTVPTGSAGGTWDIYLVVEWGTAEAGLCNAADPQVPNIDITVDGIEERLSQIDPDQ